MLLNICLIVCLVLLIKKHVSLFETQYQLTHPSVKRSILSLRKMPVFQVAAPWHADFTLSSVIPLVLSNSSLTIGWRAQPFLSGRCPFLRAFFSTCFYIILRWLFLIYYSPILPINSLFPHILTMAFFYSDTPFLSKIYYSMNGLFL